MPPSSDEGPGEASDFDAFVAMRRREVYLGLVGAVLLLLAGWGLTWSLLVFLLALIGSVLFLGMALRLYQQERREFSRDPPSEPEEPPAPPPSSTRTRKGNGKGKGKREGKPPPTDPDQG